MLQGKVLVVTGGGNGVGAEICKLAAARGARVVVNDAGVSPAGVGRDPAVANEMVAAIRKAGGEAVASVRNVADWDDAHGIIQDAIDAFGRVDAVINNAGILRDTMFHKMTREEFDSVDDVNLRGVFYVSRAAAPHFKAQQSGCYVHMTSTSQDGRRRPVQVHRARHAEIRRHLECDSAFCLDTHGCDHS
jgi:NAD(P)-dependent dehydrogenase (short-subunit alcohol dehydrogenase family)